MDEKPLREGRAEAGVGRDGRAPAEGDSRGRWGFLDCNPPPWRLSPVSMRRTKAAPHDRLSSIGVGACRSALLTGYLQHKGLSIRKLSKAINTPRASGGSSRHAHVGAIPEGEGLLVERATLIALTFAFRLTTVGCTQIKTRSTMPATQKHPSSNKRFLHGNLYSEEVNQAKRAHALQPIQQAFKTAVQAHWAEGALNGASDYQEAFANAEEPVTQMLFSSVDDMPRTWRPKANRKNGAPACRPRAPGI